MMIIGDDAQLPPVGESESAALSRRWMEGYGLNVRECVLKTVARQKNDSGILQNATTVRGLIENNAPIRLPRLDIDGYIDV